MIQCLHRIRLSYSYVEGFSFLESGESNEQHVFVSACFRKYREENLSLRFTRLALSVNEDSSKCIQKNRISVGFVRFDRKDSSLFSRQRGMGVNSYVCGGGGGGCGVNVRTTVRRYFWSRKKRLSWVAPKRQRAREWG